jgi:hypothetical protein
MRSARGLGVLQTVIGFAALLCVLVGVFTAGAASARADLFSWSSPTFLYNTARPGAQGFLRVACPSAAQCTAVDEQGGEVTFNPFAPEGAAPTTIDSSPGLHGVQCFYPPYPPGSIPLCNTVELVGPARFACPSVSQCTAVDGSGREVTFNPTAPGDPVPIKLESSVLGGVACPSVSQCTAVDDGGQQVTFNPTAPGDPSPIKVFGNGLSAVACPSVSQCTALDADAQEVTFNPMAPGNATPAKIDGGQALVSVACPSVSQCTGVDSGGRELTFNPTSPGSPVPATIDSSGELQAVVCPSVSQCTAVDRAGREVTFNPTAPADFAPTAVAGANALESVACVSAAECVVVDSAGNVFVGFARPPSITSAHQSHSRWREGRALAQISSRRTRSKHKLPRGTTFSFELNEPAAITFGFSERIGGRKVNGKCLAPRKKSHHKQACQRTVTVGTFSFAGHDGANEVVFQGRISRSKKLEPGHYTGIITATNTAGQGSAPRKLSFVIVR